MAKSSDHPFITAAARRDTRAAIRIAERDMSVHDLRVPSPYQWERALHTAVRLKSLPLARLLLDQGMDVDIPNGEDYTPLFLAPELYSRLSVVELLVERGADIHFDNDATIWSAIWQASYGYGNTLPMVYFLAEQGSKPSGLRHSAEAGKLRIAEIVTGLGADVNEVDEEGFTPLDYCTGVAHTWQFKTPQTRPRVAAFLRKHGAVNSADLDR